MGDLVARHTQLPTSIRLWRDETIGAGASKEHAVCCGGYERKTICLRDTKDGWVDIYLDPDGTGTLIRLGFWDKIKAGEGWIYTVREACSRMRIVVRQGLEAGILQGWVNLE